MTAPLISGAAGAPAIAFCHGAGFTGRSWQPIMVRLPEFFCLAPDLPGHGTERASPFTLDGAADVVIRAIRDRVPSGKAHLVGLSLGGAVVQTILRIAPDVVDHAIVTGSSDRLPGWLATASGPLLSMSRWFNPRTLARVTLKQLRIVPELRPELEEDLIAGVTDPSLMKTVVASLSRFDPPGVLAHPLLVCVGAREPGASWLYSRLSLRALRRYPAAVGISIPRGTHGWPLQFPDLFAEVVRAWVTDRPLPAGVDPIRA